MLLTESTINEIWFKGFVGKKYTFTSFWYHIWPSKTAQKPNVCHFWGPKSMNGFFGGGIKVFVEPICKSC